MTKIFSKIVESSLDSVKKVNTWLSDVFRRFQSKKITVETEVKGTERVEQAKRELESLPKTKTVEVKVEKSGDLSGLSGKTSGMEQMGQGIKQLPDPPVTLWSKMKGIFSSLRSGIKNFAGGLKEVTGYLVSSGGGALILTDGFKSRVEMGNHFRNSWIQRMNESATLVQNLARIPEAEQTNRL